MAKRYEQLLALIDEVKPRTIVEVGTHRAVRARLMVKRALRYQAQVTYIGYDVFETMDAAFHNAALNGKGIATTARAIKILGQIEGLEYSLIVGDTRRTLHGRAVTADFAFIDGDHRVDAVAGDFEALSQCPVVVFDDYFRPGGVGPVPDLELFGANKVVDALNPQLVEILPVTDECRDGGVSHLAVYRYHGRGRG